MKMFHKAKPPATPTKGEIPGRLGSRVEMLVKPLIGWDNNAAGFPFNARRLLGLRPEKRVTLSSQDEHVRPRSMTVRFFVRADGKLGDVSGHRLASDVKFHVGASGPAL